MKILLAEDTRDMNRVLTVALQHSGYEVDSCFDGKQALQNAMSNGYDAMVMDIMMPEMNGIDVLKELRSRNIVTPVLLLTAKAEIDDRVTGLDAGADDYLTKPFAMKELLARVRAMTRRKKDYSKELMSFGDFTLNGENFELRSQNSVRLSVKEFELLQALLLNAERDISADYLLEHIWDSRDAATASTLKLYIAYIRSKLNAIASRAVILEEHGLYRLSFHENVK